MKKLALLALAVLLVPSIVNAACYPATAFEWYDLIGNPYSLPDGDIPIVAGQTLYWNEQASDASLAVCILHLLGETTYAGGYVTDTEGWTFGEYANTCRGYIGDGVDVWGCYYWFFSISCPLEAVLGTIDTVTLVATMCDDVTNELDPACEIVSDYSTLVAYFEVVPPPEPIEIFQDTLTNIDEGVAEAYIRFEICNGTLDEEADPKDYEYWITSLGLVGDALDINEEILDVPSGECRTIYAIVDASEGVDCDWDTLTILGFYDTTGPGGIYDTCVQVIHVVTPREVPLFTTPVITVMVLAMILAAAVIMRKRVTSNA